MLLFLHRCLSIRCWAAVTLCCGLAIISRVSKVECTFSTFLFVNTCQSGTLPCVLALTFKYRVEMQGLLLFEDHLNEINCFTFPWMYPLKCLLCMCCLNILDSRVEICVTEIWFIGELRSVINLWLDDYGHSSYQKVNVSQYVFWTCYICSRRRLAVARYRMISLVLMESFGSALCDVNKCNCCTIF